MSTTSIAAFGIGLLTIALIMLLIVRLRPMPDDSDGVLHIDISNPEFDNYYFEITTPLEDLPSKDTITLKIQTHSSQEN